MNNQDTHIRPTTPGQSVRAIEWHWGESVPQELVGPVGTYLGPNEDENADDDQNSIFDFFGERVIGDKRNGYAVVEDNPHTTEAFDNALTKGHFEYVHSVTLDEVMDKFFTEWFSHTIYTCGDKHKFFYTIKDGNIIVRCYRLICHHWVHGTHTVTTRDEFIERWLLKSIKTGIKYIGDYG